MQHHPDLAVNPDEVSVVDLPASARELVDVVGLPAAWRLIVRHGGTVVYVPESISASHPLGDLLGKEAAAALASRYGKGSIEVPRCLRARTRQRNSLLIRDAVAGASQQDLARKYALTTRAVRLVMATARFDRSPAPRGARHDHQGAAR